MLFGTYVYGVDHPVQVGGAGFTFSPATLTINQGDTVTFTNAGGTHNVHATNGPTLFTCGLNCSSNTGPNGTAWSHQITFDTPGTVNYQCDAHFGAPFFMTGTITVNAPTPVRLQSFDVNK
jgi:plastocyanin